jgi:hypothetical protein
LGKNFGEAGSTLVAALPFLKQKTHRNLWQKTLKSLPYFSPIIFSQKLVLAALTKTLLLPSAE